MTERRIYLTGAFCFGKALDEMRYLGKLGWATYDADDQAWVVSGDDYSEMSSGQRGKIDSAVRYGATLETVES